MDGSGVARIDTVLTGVGLGHRAKAVTPERLNTVFTRVYAGHVSANTAQRVGVESAGFGGDIYSPGSPTHPFSGPPPRLALHPRHVPVNQQPTERRGTKDAKVLLLGLRRTARFDHAPGV
jgi:hypothetical protein